MRITLFTKREKPTVREVINYFKKDSHNITVYQGNREEPFPEKAFDESSDILISYLSPWRIPKKLLDKTKFWNINFHPGPPAYPGIGCFNFALYNEEKTYGVTAHLMNEKVDSGRIIAVKKFPLLESDSVYSLSIKSYKYMLSLFFEVIEFILKKNEIPKCNEVWRRKPYTRRELENLCKIDLGMSKSEVEKRIKVTSYPNMPAAYIDIFDYRFSYDPDR